MKKRNFFKCSLLASLGLLVFGVGGLTACGSTSEFAVPSVRINNPEVLAELSVGETVRLSVSVTKGYSGEVRWFSSNENVVIVRGGYVTAVGEGHAIITAAFLGGYSSVDVVVVAAGEGGSDEPSARLSVSPTSKTIGIGTTLTLSVNKYPATTVVDFESSDVRVASVNAEGVVTALAVGSTIITATGDNGKVATCNITVKEDAGGDDYDIAVDSDLKLTGTLRVGTPKIQRNWMISILEEFNQKTNSSITFEVPEFEEDNGTSGYNSAAAMPDVFPYASDQTLTLSQFKALSKVSTTDSNWIKENMGEDAQKAAKLSSNVVGYPFAADNGVVMFYDSSAVSADQIKTLDQIFTIAEQRDMEVNFAISNGFYAAGSLMTYSGGQSLYTLTAKNTDYTSKATFSQGDAGLKAAKLIKKIVSNDTVRNASTAPDSTKDVLVTITDVSKVAAFKAQLGSRYAVAPLPFVDEANTIRLGSYLGYKFYGVNNSLSTDGKKAAAAVAKFLCSEYVQVQRFNEFYTRPTLNSLNEYAANEPHINALVEQSATHSTIALTAVSSELWSQTATAITSIKSLPSSASDGDYTSILEVLDKALTRG